jgi:hypothetical protein
VKTRCVRRRDEWGNFHDRLESGDDVAIMALFAYPGSVVDVYITEDLRVLVLHRDSRTLETFCDEVPLEEYASTDLGRERVQKLCKAIRAGGRKQFNSLRVVAAVLKFGVAREVCRSG